MVTKKKREDTDLPQLRLTDGELVLWVGQPNPNWLLSSKDLLLVPFSLMWGGFAIFWETGVLIGGAPFPFGLWGIPFVLIGQYFIWGRFVYKYLRRRQTRYVVTDRRAVVINDFFSHSEKVYFLHQISSLHRQGKAITFNLDEPMRYRRRNWQDWSGEAEAGFYALPDADEVYDLIQDLILPSKVKNDWD